jgi:hypothetical protein
VIAAPAEHPNHDQIQQTNRHSPRSCSNPINRRSARAALTALFAAGPDIHLDPDSPPIFSYGARGHVQHGTETLPVLLGT